MPNSPTLPEIRQRMTADLEYRLPAAQSRPAKSVLSVLTTVMSGAISSLYGFGQWITQQLDPMTCSEEWLFIWGERLKVPRKGAEPAKGLVSFSGGNTLIPSGTRLRSSNTDAIYITISDGYVGNDVSVAVIAETVGEIGNLDTDQVLQLETPISGIELDVAIVWNGLTGGADEELISDWRIRVTEKLAERQKIGDADDYETWVKAAHTDILDAKAASNYPSLGVITIWALGSASDPVLSQTVLNAAEEQLQLTRNMGCTVIVAAAQVLAVDIRIADVDEDSQDTIEASIAELFLTRATFNAQVWPEEIERIVLLHTDQFTLLEPVAKVTAGEYQILTLGEFEWL